MRNKIIVVKTIQKFEKILNSSYFVKGICLCNVFIGEYKGIPVFVKNNILKKFKKLK